MMSTPYRWALRWSLASVSCGSPAASPPPTSSAVESAVVRDSLFRGEELPPPGPAASRAKALTLPPPSTPSLVLICHGQVVTLPQGETFSHQPHLGELLGVGQIIHRDG